MRVPMNVNNNLPDSRLLTYYNQIIKKGPNELQDIIDPDFAMLSDIENEDREERGTIAVLTPAELNRRFTIAAQRDLDLTYEILEKIMDTEMTEDNKEKNNVEEVKQSEQTSEQESEKSELAVQKNPRKRKQTLESKPFTSEDLQAIKMITHKIIYKKNKETQERIVDNAQVMEIKTEYPSQLQIQETTENEHKILYKNRKEIQERTMDNVQAMQIKNEVTSQFKIEEIVEKERKKLKENNEPISHISNGSQNKETEVARNGETQEMLVECCVGPVKPPVKTYQRAKMLRRNTQEPSNTLKCSQSVQNNGNSSNADKN